MRSSAKPDGRQSQSLGRLGFTLIEILIVVAIIALLAGILFPVFARSRESARRASCQSNEKQITLGLKQYLEDHNQKYPPGPKFAEDLFTFADVGGGLNSYLKNTQIFICASDSVKTGSYCYMLDRQKETNIYNTAQEVLLRETLGTRHLNGQNLAYVDGHVKWTNEDTLTCAEAAAASGATVTTGPTVIPTPAPTATPIVVPTPNDGGCNAATDPNCGGG